MEIADVTGCLVLAMPPLVHSASLATDLPASGPPVEGLVLADRYRVLEFVAHTRSCDFYRGEHVRLGRSVTIKFLGEALSKQAEARAQFQRVADTMSNLRHPHIVEILECDATSTGVPYFVFEGGNSQRLDRWLIEQPRRTNREAGDLVGQIGSALAAAHEAGIVHGALSPASIAVLSLETGPFLKLSDFGFSGPRADSGAAEAPDDWDVRYLAPEQAVGKVTPSPSTDQYQLAALAFEMFAGHGLFPTARTKDELVRQIIETPSPSLRRSCPGTPVVLEAALARALSKSPELRFPSLTEFVTTLRRAVGSLSESAGTGLSGRQRLEAFRREPGVAAGHAPTLRGGHFERAPVSAVRRTSGRYSTSDIALELDGDLARARAARVKGQSSLALGYLRDVVERGRVDTGRAGVAAVTEAEAQLKLLVAQFVPLAGSRLRRDDAFSDKDAGLRKEGAQLLALVTGEMTVAEIIGASPLVPSETWCCLATLLCRGALKPAKPAV